MLWLQLVCKLNSYLQACGLSKLLNQHARSYTGVVSTKSAAHSAVTMYRSIAVL